MPIRFALVAFAAPALLLSSPLIGAEVMYDPTSGMTIQSMINDADPGDVIVVPVGTYFESINFNGKGVTVRSADPDDPAVVAQTVLTSSNAVDVIVAFISGEGNDSVLRGLTIRGGDTQLIQGVTILNSSPVIDRCVFVDNASTLSVAGGAISILGDLDTEEVPIIVSCEFFGNCSNQGGAIGTTSASPSIQGCRFVSNTSTGNGGALTFVGSQTRASVFDCVFEGNNADLSGGGVAVFNFAGATIINGLFVGNACERDFEGGGAAYFDSNAPIRFVNCTLIGNEANGMSAGGGGIATLNGNPLIRSCVLWDNTPDQLQNTSNVNYSLIQGGAPGPGNVDADPMFVDAPNGNYRLGAGSPAIDAGNNNALQPLLLADLDGNPRIVDDPNTPDSGNGTAPFVDMGAYEFQGASAVCAGDCDDNGVVDFNDLVSMLFEFGNPGDARCDADESGTVDFNDLVAALFLFGPCV